MKERKPMIPEAPRVKQPVPLRRRDLQEVAYYAMDDEKNKLYQKLMEKMPEFLEGKIGFSHSNGKCRLLYGNAYLHIGNRCIGRELAVKAYFQARLTDLLAEVKISRQIRKQMNSHPHATEKLMQDREMMILLDEAFSVMQDTGTFCTREEWDAILRGEVDEQFMAIAGEKYMRMICGDDVAVDLSPWSDRTGHNANGSETGSDSCGNGRYPGEDSSRSGSYAGEDSRQRLIIRRGQIMDPCVKWILDAEPIGADQDSVVQEFLSRKKESNPYYAENKIFRAQDGTRLRSKIEVRAWELILSLKIPALYEPKWMVGNHVVYPDFLLMNPYTHRIIAMELFGMMGDPDYRNHTKRKLEIYMDHEYLIGQNLLVYMERPDQPIDFIKMKLDLKYHCLRKDL